MDPIARRNKYMNLDKETAIEDFKNFLDLPLLGKSLLLKLKEYKDVVAANINEFKNIVELRNRLKKNDNEWPKQKTPDKHRFEIVNVNGIWIPVLTDDKDCEPSRLFPGKLVNYLVKKAENMEYGIIQQETNLTLPGLKGKVFNIWFEKLEDDYIVGIIKAEISKREPKIDADLEYTLKELKDIDFERIFEIFRLIFEEEKFRQNVYKVYLSWNILNQESPGIITG